MNGYQLTRQWFSFKFENSHKVSSAHTEFYFYLLDRWNRFGQKEVFSCPRLLTMEVLGIGSQNTYKRIYQDLIAFGFIEEVSKACNRYKEASYVRLSKNDILSDSLSDSLPDNLSDILSDTIIELKNIGTKELKKEGGEKKVKEKKKFIAPSVDEVRAYFEEKAYPLDLVQQVYSHYADADWTKANGGKVIDWKRTISNNWQEKFDRHKARQQQSYQNVNQNYYPPRPEEDPILLRQEVHSNYGDYVRHCLKVGHQPEKPKYPELVPADFDHIAFINQIKSTL
jgi:hypothetical protein